MVAVIDLPRFDRCRCGCLKLCECLLHPGQDTSCTTVVVEAEQLAAGAGEVEPLGGLVEVVARTLAGDLAVELSFGILLASVVGLVDGDCDELGLQQLDDLGVGEG
ncbi:MAG: hypothetical protein HN891_04915 [Planctomycetes bacterium]|jgi:hypothetical protein|nr:hypothetical protein [Planctomycetota bacterium]MBT6451438.1 hypothetical protein [Planctomycetota bacterium]MBT6540089.1 hypothetical protein [Planctomycetota bacterium]MBT7103976.1 hypothetical protein [Planctomycetota bacterium]MBT7130029.1 hypothetical protein [Planctomycetota bacterium]